MTADGPAAAPLPETPVTTGASDSGVGNLGFSGTAVKSTPAGPVGMTTLADDTFGNGTTIPMMPGSWQIDADGADPGGN